MKKLTILILSLLVFVQVNAQQFIDNANLIKDADVHTAIAAQLSDHPVMIETLESSPNPSLKSYCDDRALAVFGSKRGFYIGVTLHPRAWRISMWPTGVVSGAVVEKIGNDMAAGFKRGDFRSAFADTAARLDTALRDAKSTKGSSQSGFDWEFWMWIGLFVLIVIVLVVIFMGYRESNRAQERTNSRKHTPSSREYIPPSRNRAQKEYDKYSSAERERIIVQYQSSPHYTPACHTDPMQFYLFMYMTGAFDHHNNGGGQSYYSEPYSSPSAPYSPPSHQSEPSRSSDYDSGSSGSWGSSSSPSYESPSSSSDSSSSWGSSDSGSSSSSDSSSSSSCDSSGGSGSW